ncbi:MAG: bifunctional phosphoribosylaminoimidazolecarboxamide formyltransferase/IMP cyclohydrolase [Thermoanaerobaculia bacterium]
MLSVTRALLSVSDKTGLIDLARGLSELGVELVSTGGTERHLTSAGLPVRPVAELTGFPEMLDGRVKTLHPRIHGGILADRDKPEHLAALAEHDIGRIDLVVVNLYPFEATISRPGAAPAEAIEMIDIGGPSMLRAAAKNFAGVAVVVDPGDYPALLDALSTGDRTVPQAMRRRLAGKAFAHSAGYDATIAHWFEETSEESAPEAVFPERTAVPLVRELVPRYGENPHQAAAVYRFGGGRGLLGGMRQLQGKEMSWNNVLDADAARKLAGLFSDPAVVLVKHNNPCGVGRGPELRTAYRRALASDPVSAFGGILATNQSVDADLVAEFGDLFLEVLVAPAITEAAREALATRKNLRVLECPNYAPSGREIEFRGVDGGFLAQVPDAFADDPSAWTSPTRRSPSPEESRALAFAWSVARYTKSNAIVICSGDQTLGVGAGQMSRVDSCRLAIEKARSPLAGSVAASDAFFPFRDGVDVLAAAGVTAIAQPGGSRRDDEIVAAADEHGIAMVFTGRRHFRH